MATLRYQQQAFELETGQSVLQCLTGHGVPVPYSCQVGVCQTCLMRATEGVPPEAAQLGLKDSLKSQHYFLACLCKPEADLAAALPDDAHTAVHAIVRKLELLSHDVMLVELETESLLYYRAGQFINLVRDGEHVRSYSLASVPRLDKHLQLHVRRLPLGKVSGWVHEELQIGQKVEIRGPAGDCIYVRGKPEQPMLLIGTGSGLAPLYGILRDALDLGHVGPVHLFHGSREPDGLYLAEELREIERRYPNFTYHPCLSGGHVPEGCAAGRAHEAALRAFPNLKGWRLFLCGHPEMVKAAQKKAFLAGASLQEIHADAFNVSHA